MLGNIERNEKHAVDGFLSPVIRNMGGVQPARHAVVARKGIFEVSNFAFQSAADERSHPLVGNRVENILYWSADQRVSRFTEELLVSLINPPIATVLRDVRHKGRNRIH